MTQQYINEQKELLISTLGRNWLPGINNLNKQDWTFCNGIEFIVNPGCNQKCKYCYLTQYGKELYPQETRCNKETTINNLKTFLNYLNEHKIFLKCIDIFGGDIISDGLRLMERNPDYFYDDIHIEAAYGNFHYCIFDGGRVFTKYHQATKEEIKETIEKYNDYGVKIRYIFTNNQLSQQDYYNRFCNIMLKEGQARGNQIVLVDRELQEFIQNRYNGYDFISSTTKCITSLELLQKELENPLFKEVCLDYNLNKNFDQLEKLPEELKGKCEFLVNAICPPNCPTRKEHYKLNSLQYLNFNKPQKVPTCGIAANTLHPIQTENQNNISPEEIYELYALKGFQHFKIEGRTLSSIENACNYV